MRKYLFLFTFLLLSAKSFAQDKDFNYKFYGQIRTDFYYNSRANEETVDGLFYMYPKDKVYDATGKDLNATANGSFYMVKDIAISALSRFLAFAGKYFHCIALWAVQTIPNITVLSHAM